MEQFLMLMWGYIAIRYWKITMAIIALCCLMMISTSLFGDINGLLALSIFFGVITFFIAIFCLMIIFDRNLTWKEKWARLTGQ